MLAREKAGRETGGRTAPNPTTEPLSRRSLQPPRPPPPPGPPEDRPGLPHEGPNALPGPPYDPLPKNETPETLRSFPKTPRSLLGNLRDSPGSPPGPPGTPQERPGPTPGPPSPGTPQTPQNWSFWRRFGGQSRDDSGQSREAFPTPPAVVDRAEGTSRGRRCGPPRGRPR